MGEHHRVEIRTASEVQAGDEILDRQYKPVLVDRTERDRGVVTLYRREGPPRHVLQQIGHFSHAEPMAVLVRSAESAEEPTDAEVEGGARVLAREAKATGDQGDWNPWEMLHESEKEELRREARAVLKGARDGEAAMREREFESLAHKAGPTAMPEEGLEPPAREGAPAATPEEGLEPPAREGAPAATPEERVELPIPGTGPAAIPGEGLQPPSPGGGPAPMPEEGREPPAREGGPAPMPEEGLEPPTRGL